MPSSAEPYNTLCRLTMAASSVYTSINTVAYIFAFLFIHFSVKTGKCYKQGYKYITILKTFIIFAALIKKRFP